RAAGAFDGVVAVDEVDRVIAEEFLETLERFLFVGERHHPGVGAGTEDGNAVADAGFGITGSIASADIGGARGENAGFGGMGATGAEFNDGSSKSGFDHA